MSEIIKDCGPTNALHSDSDASTPCIIQDGSLCIANLVDIPNDESSLTTDGARQPISARCESPAWS